MKSSRAQLIGMLALAGLGLAAAGGFYATRGAPGNSTCSAARSITGKLKPLATGDVAAVQVFDDPAPAPNLIFFANGAPTKLTDFNGKAVLVNLWATWCIPCRAEMPQLVSLEARYRARGVKLITVSCDEPDQEAGALNFLQKHGVPQPAYIKRAANDEKFIDSVDPKWSGALPGLFVYDRQGRLVKSLIGEVDIATLDAVLKKLL